MIDKDYMLNSIRNAVWILVWLNVFAVIGGCFATMAVV